MYFSLLWKAIEVTGVVREHFINQDVGHILMRLHDVGVSITGMQHLGLPFVLRD
jgi:hypothetical protein